MAATKSFSLWFVLGVTISMFSWTGVTGQQFFPTRRMNLGGVMIGDCSETLELGVMIDGTASVADQMAALSTEGLLSEALLDGDTPSGTGPRVGIFDTQIVCTAAGRMRGTIGSISVVVSFAAVGVPGAPQPGDLLNLTEQFQFDCTADDVFDDNIVDGDIRSSSGASLGTVRDDRCGQCVDPNSVSSPLDQADPDTHCLACHPDCNQGMMRCIGTGADQCCNWYYNDQCVINCPGELVGDSTSFECGCSSLALENGDISFSNMSFVGSVATHTCDRENGYVLSDVDSNVMESTRNCSEDDWSGTEITCELFDCGSPMDETFDADTGTASFSNQTFGSVATFTCNSGYMLQGSASRTCGLEGWSGTLPSCMLDDGDGGLSGDTIGGIIGGILAGILLIAIVVAVTVFLVVKLKKK